MAQRKINRSVAQKAAPQQKQPTNNNVLIPDAWYNCVIIDMDPEYQSQSSPAVLRVLKVQLKGSRRFGDRTLNFFVGEQLKNTNRHDGSSTRQDLIDRFGWDVWNDDESDNYLDLPVRAHIGITDGRDGNHYNRVISIYPMQTQGTTTNDVDTQPEEEIPF